MEGGQLVEPLLPPSLFPFSVSLSLSLFSLDVVWCLCGELAFYFLLATGMGKRAGFDNGVFRLVAYIYRKRQQGTLAGPIFIFICFRGGERASERASIRRVSMPWLADRYRSRQMKRNHIIANILTCICV